MSDTKVKLLDHGFVQYVSHSGDEAFISRMAGISHMNETGPSVDKLLAWEHMSPFEFANITFRIKCPIFVARQLMRHRTASYVEKSLRYNNADPEFFSLEMDNTEDTRNVTMASAYKQSYENYLALLKEGKPKEQARTVLPLGMYTEYFFQFDLNNLLKMLKLRLDKHAQQETRMYAYEVYTILNEHFPTIGKWVHDNYLES